MPVDVALQQDDDEDSDREPEEEAETPETPKQPSEFQQVMALLPHVSMFITGAQTLIDRLDVERSKIRDYGEPLTDSRVTRSLVRRRLLVALQSVRDSAEGVIVTSKEPLRG